ncbi:MAG: DUF4398 domain-containing protein [Spirochaetales bacterium]|nr:DUF4398 domain-containing protein [Spirochaetales bacterium]
MLYTQKTTVALAMAGLLFYCSKPVPVQELSQARQEIARAEANGAASHAKADIDSAREKLVVAHSALGEEKYKDAKIHADAAFEAARRANLASAPKAAYAEYQAARTSLDSADKAWAEELAKPEFQDAREKNARAIASYKQAKEKSEALPALTEKSTATEKENRAMQEEAVIAQFAASRDDFVAARAAADAAKSKALARKGEKLNALAGVEKTISKAEQFGGATTAAGEIQQARTAATRARTLFGQDNLKDGQKELLAAEKSANAALNKAMPAFAEQKKSDAAKAIMAAESSYKSLGAGALKNQPAARSIEESLAAGREALSSAEKNYSAKQYEKSIQDSEEAMRLALIVNEQSIALARSAPSGGTKEPAVSGDRTYEIGKSDPPECLSCISGKKNVYGDPYMWVKIYEANKDKINNPHLIFPGQTLVIPEVDAEEKARLKAEALRRQKQYLQKRARPAAQKPAPAAPASPMEPRPRESIQ